MFKKKDHIQISKRVLLLVFILFSLASCAVKEVLLDSLDISFSKSLNKSRSSVPASFCQYNDQGNQQVSIVKKAEIKKQERVDFYETLHFVNVASKFNAAYSKSYSGNSPPKYILYKCLKLDIA